MPAVIIFFLVSLIGGYAAMNAATRDAARVDAAASISATYILSYKSALVAFNAVPANAAVTGTITNAMLAPYWPQGMVAKAGWTNNIYKKPDVNPVVFANTDPVLFIYETTLSTQQSVLEDLYIKTGKSYLVGRSNGVSLVGATGVNTGIVIPVLVPPIPAGAIVLIGK